MSCDICDDGGHTTVESTTCVFFTMQQAIHVLSAPGVQPLVLWALRENVGPDGDPPENDDDSESAYQSVCEDQELGNRSVLPYIHRLRPHDDLFYETVILGGKVTVTALLDSGSMACTLSSSVITQLLCQTVLETPTLTPTDVVLIGCGGSKTILSGACDQRW